MLLGVEHIQFCVRDLEASRAYLEGVGYRTVFQVQDFDREGEQLPRYHGRGKSMIYMRGTSSALELIDGDIESATTGYVPVLPPSMMPSGLDSDGDTVRVAPLETYCRTGASGVSLQELRLGTSTLDASVRFWQELGGRVESADEKSAILSFAARIATMPLQLTLHTIGSGPTAGPFVDELGCRLVAMLSTSLDDDLSRIAGAGGRPSQVRSLTIHGRTLRISFVVTPSGELVEIIEASR